MKMIARIRSIKKSTKGAPLVEYTILVGLIGILAIAAVLQTGEKIKESFDLTSTTITEYTGEPGIGSGESSVPRYDSNDISTYIIDTGIGIPVFSPTGPTDAAPGEVILRCAMPGMIWQPWGGYEVPGMIETANELTSRPDSVGPSRTDTIPYPNPVAQNWYGEYIGLHVNGFHYWGITARIPADTLRDPGRDGCQPW